MGLVLPLAAGALLPVLLFMGAFALRGGLADLARGLIAGTGAHIRSRFFLPTLSAFWPAVPYTIVLGAGSLPRLRFARPLLILLAAILGAALWLSGTSRDIYLAAWYSARFLGVSVVFAACLRLADAHRRGFWSAETRQKIFLLVSRLQIMSLVQFRQSPSYFSSVISCSRDFARRASRGSGSCCRVCLLTLPVYSAAQINTSHIRPLATISELVRLSARSTFPGRRLRPREDASVYASLIRLVQEKSGGKPVYAGPDSPEIHFLSGLADAAPRGVNAPRDPLQRPEELLRILREKDTRVAVLNRRPPFHHLRAATFAQFEEVFPNSREIGRFVVRWKD
jgi:hypothetical protein